MKNIIKWLASPHPQKWNPLGRKIVLIFIRSAILKTFNKKVEAPVYLRLIRSLRSLSSTFLLPIIIVFFTIAMTIWLNEEEVYSARDILKIIFDKADSIAIITAAVIFIWEVRTRKKREHYEAWQMISSPKGNLSGSERVQALKDLNQDGISLSRINLSKSDLSRVNLSWGNISEVNFEEANLSLANFRDSFLIRYNFCKATLFGSDLRNCALYEANLEGADLSFSSLKGANLASANLKGANLWGANLKGADLRGANLENADLRDTNLEDSDLRKAILKKAMFGRHRNFGIETFQIGNLATYKMTEASFKNIKWDDSTDWEGVEGLEATNNVPNELRQKLGIHETQRYPRF